MIQRTPRSSLFPSPTLFFFFFNDTATTEIYTLSLHDALPILEHLRGLRAARPDMRAEAFDEGDVIARPRGFDDIERIPRGRIFERGPRNRAGDRKSTRLNSSHTVISYAVFCLK